MATLAEHGWLPISPGQAGSACKEFPSLFGDKEAQVHCTVHASTANQRMQLYLRGNYFSEGRNPLARANEDFPAVASIAEVEAAVEEWIVRAEAAMNDTFAVRMLRQQQQGQSANAAKVA